MPIKVGGGYQKILIVVQRDEVRCGGSEGASDIKMQPVRDEGSRE